MFEHRGTNCQVPITSNPASQHTCFTFSPCSSAAVTPTEGQLAPATRVTFLLPGEDCEDLSTQFSTALCKWPPFLNNTFELARFLA